MACCLEWVGPETEFPHGLNRHICNLPKYHAESCQCICGAKRQQKSRTVGESPAPEWYG